MNRSSLFSSTRNGEGKDEGERTETEEREVCAICLAEFEEANVVSELKCGHVFHACCMNAWENRSDACRGTSTTCPLCREYTGDAQRRQGGQGQRRFIFLRDGNHLALYIPFLLSYCDCGTQDAQDVQDVQGAQDTHGTNHTHQNTHTASSSYGSSYGSNYAFRVFTMCVFFVPAFLLLFLLYTTWHLAE